MELSASLVSSIHLPEFTPRWQLLSLISSIYAEFWWANLDNLYEKPFPYLPPNSAIWRAECRHGESNVQYVRHTVEHPTFLLSLVLFSAPEVYLREMLSLTSGASIPAQWDAWMKKLINEWTELAAFVGPLSRCFAAKTECHRNFCPGNNFAQRQRRFSRYSECRCE